ncbi:MAG: peptidoglycan editing factor PgeF [Eubacterium sp.]|nr:peptidoglycan editing factor PgeF [Eubacterium sp.]
MNFVQLNKYAGNTTKVKFSTIPYLVYPALESIDFIRHGFSTRLGGVSEGHLASMNLGWERDDLRENVVKNHEIIAEAMGFDAKNIVTSHQTHTTNVRLVTKEDCGKGIYRERDFDNVDGLITQEKNVVLATYFADCVPLFLVDPKQKAIGLSHSGWKGTVGKIGKKTIEKMEECFGTKPEDVIACVGPSICQECYEVSGDVARQFQEVFPKHRNEILKDRGSDKYLLNLWKCNELIFQESGVRPEHIHVTDVCTCCNTDVLFSHRGHQGKRGNLAAFLEIKE